MRLKDQIAVVTGGGGGIGEGICLCLAREGADIVVSDLKLDLAEAVASKVRAEGRKALAIQTDVRQPDQCQGLIDAALGEMGGLDILVCCAGVMGYERREDLTAEINIENFSEEEWDMTIDVNLKGVFFCNRAAIPHFKAQQKGKIINISSVAGREGVAAFLAPYAASKAGVINLTQSLAQYLAPFNINVNTVCPGIIWTPMWKGGVNLLAQGNRDVDQAAMFQSIIDDQIAFKRGQSPEDMGKAVVFFASDDAKEITGQALNVCGGMRFN